MNQLLTEIRNDLTPQVLLFDEAENFILNFGENDIQKLLKQE